MLVPTPDSPASGPLHVTPPFHPSRRAPPAVPTVPPTPAELPAPPAIEHTPSAQQTSMLQPGTIVVTRHMCLETGTRMTSHPIMAIWGWTLTSVKTPLALAALSHHRIQERKDVCPSPHYLVSLCHKLTVAYAVSSTRMTHAIMRACARVVACMTWPLVMAMIKKVDIAAARGTRTARFPVGARWVKLLTLTILTVKQI